MTALLCADVGSTYTKVAAIGPDGTLLAAASHHTTADTDVLDGLSAACDAATAQLPADVEVGELRVCSSAGGGLRLAVIGNEPLVTATAAHRAGLSAGARVVHIAAGVIGTAELSDLARSRPDVILLAGGTDGGDETVVRDHATVLARGFAEDPRLRVPVVVAANNAAAGDIVTQLTAAGGVAQQVDNVLPIIGTLQPGPARTALREVFLRHVIAGKRLSSSSRFETMVRAATPDAVLAGVELLADGSGGADAVADLVVVDVGGATTDVYSVLTPDAELTGPRREVAGTAWRSRTVEGDLGLRHTAAGILAAAVDEQLITREFEAELAPAVAWRTGRPDWLPDSPQETAIDLRLTELAIMIALRRHARGERLGGPQSPLRGGKDLRAVRLIVGSGGVLRNHPEAVSVLRSATAADTAGGYPLPEDPTAVIDVSYVLAAAGLLADEHPRIALDLLKRNLTSHS
ncbi:uncharacterized protein (TIGR01319 family) [Stackebrandtia endophytica]|uniref:Uncharacterized protein (TIGR01319 family) n=1 Tax=Stackebrandtia endophytica TaxID=1496996 RepID=A0A543B4B8_9ACTN|nr:glutamate mutase L [Stackebrandtia endophytica]TQL79630.1 uncharacterized protein (TIGR01319 family) [Stackebrandtia endophytica]